MWQGLRAIIDYKGSPGGVTNPNPSLRDEFNLFYARFDVENSEPITKMANHPEDYVLKLNESEIRRTFRRLKAGKAASPDTVPPRVFKTCAGQLAPMFTDLFNASLYQSVVPVCFKKTTIVLLPKETKVTGLNDYRPVALTPKAMKCPEKLVMTHINSIIPDSSDPLQFAYRTNRSVDDAISLTLHTAQEKLDRRDTYVRLLFIDFSSAFNTSVPSKMILKLRDLDLGTPICNILWTSRQAGLKG